MFICSYKPYDRSIVDIKCKGMSIEYEILRYVCESGGELDYDQIDATLTNDNFHSEVERLKEILEGLVKAECLSVHPLFDVAVYTITNKGIEYLYREANGLTMFE